MAKHIDALLLVQSLVTDIFVKDQLVATLTTVRLLKHCIIEALRVQCARKREAYLSSKQSHRARE